MKTGLVVKYLKERFFNEGKTNIIVDYLDYKGEALAFKHYTYTNGTEVWVDTLNEKAYTNNGVLFAVVLKDNEYLENLWENHSVEIIDYINNLYEDNEGDEKGKGTEEDEEIEEDE